MTALSPDPERAERQFRQALESLKLPHTQQITLISLASTWAKEVQRQEQRQRAEGVRDARTP